MVMNGEDKNSDNITQDSNGMAQEQNCMTDSYMQTENDEEIINKQMSSMVSTQEVSNDSDLVQLDNKNLNEHSEQYTNILKAYCETYKNNSTDKLNSRKIMCICSIIILVAVTLFIGVTIIFVLVLVACGKNNIPVFISTIISSLVTFGGTYLVIPKMITGYLFNKEEENNLKEIIAKIQEYDLQVRNQNKKE